MCEDDESNVTEITLAQIKMRRIDHILSRLLNWTKLKGFRLQHPLNHMMLLLFSIHVGETIPPPNILCIIF